ncbi:uncharacterized protein TM35_000271440 [Trypanosoma theileri]|uniref:WW domain-containing protein n=1 Tax=Trypanosoma theileri TaxID=67003 RepID=A0A1X0NPE0_9TRYP|nr:uncharacterized protein TM35_000271440 [Trypanosoma theileri]ORC86554.1 hypothetical protein TM35_000271440 [Trypanosoma theileri]
MALSIVSLQQFKRDLYAAETLSDAGRALLQAVPYWLPFVSAGACITTYILTMRLRLFIAKWRRTARRRAERKYRALGHLHNGIPPPCSSFTIVEDDEDDDNNSYRNMNKNGSNNDNDNSGISNTNSNNGNNSEDSTTLSMLDIEEFRRSLGIRSPRDDDLLVMVEEMLLVDPIPDGWVLYRTTAGVVRFMNINTQELFFFHPDKQEEEQYIRAELQRRNKTSLEAKYKFSCSDEERTFCGVASLPSSSTPPISWKQQINKGKRSNKVRADDNDNNIAAPMKFSDSDAYDYDYDYDEHSYDDGKDTQSTFRRLFHYFLEREKRKIERDVEKKFRHSTGALVISGSGGTSGDIGTPSFENRTMRLISANTVYNHNYSNTHPKRASST